MAFWGDVMPFVPIANELARRGHDVTFAVPEGFWPILANESFTLARPVPSSTERARRGRRPSRACVVSARHRTRGSVLDRRVRRAADAVNFSVDRRHRRRRPRTHASDRVVHRAGWSRNSATSVGHRPSLSDAHPDHRSFPTRLAAREARAPAFSASRAVRCGSAVERMSALACYDRQINVQRIALGRSGAGQRDGRRVVARARPAALVEGVGAARIRLARRLHDDGLHHLAGPTGQALPETLTDYLEHGDPPVLVTLGTSAASNAGELFESIAEVLDRTGRRPRFSWRRLQGFRADGGVPDVWPFAPITKGAAATARRWCTPAVTAPPAARFKPACRRWWSRCCTTSSGTPGERRSSGSACTYRAGAPSVRAGRAGRFDRRHGSRRGLRVAGTDRGPEDGPAEAAGEIEVLLGRR